MRWRKELEAAKATKNPDVPADRRPDGNPASADVRKVVIIRTDPLPADKSLDPAMSARPISMIVVAIPRCSGGLEHDGTIHLGMDARGGLAALRDRARPLRGPAARSAIAGAAGRPARDGAGRPAIAVALAGAVGPRSGDAAPRRRAGSPAGHPPDAQAAPLEPTDLRFPINLATALRLSDARPLIVAAAQASVWVAEAELTPGQGPLGPDAQHRLRLHPPRRRRPGLQQGHPDRAEHELLLRRCRPVGTAPGDHLHDRCHLPAPGGPAGPERPALGHPDRQERRPAADRRRLLPGAPVPRACTPARSTCVERGHDLVERIATLSRDLVPEFEVDRARNMLADLEQQAVSARQQWRVQSADLTQVLRLDPRAVVEPLEHDHLQITLIDPGRSLDDLMPIALTNRPELASRQALVQAADGGDPPGEGAPVHPQRRAQRLPDPLRDAPGRDLRLRPQQQPEPVDGPRRLQHPAPLAARRISGSATSRMIKRQRGHAVAGHHRPVPRPRTRWRRT